jgi:GNAT superfamily N-acetyltransferase
MDRRTDLDRARREAKALLRAARAGDAEALARMRPDREPRLADAQRAVARELGEPSWPALVRRVETQVATGVDDLLRMVFAGEHHAALSLAGERPQLAERLRAAHAGELLRAAREGRADAAYTLLELGVDANVRDPASGGTALHVAASMGAVDVVDVLVGWVPLDLHARDREGQTALGACAGAAAPGADHVVAARVLVSVGLRPEAGMARRAGGELGAWLRQQAARPLRPPVRDDALGELAWSADVALLTHLAGSQRAEARDAGDGFVFSTGLHDNTRNGVVCSRLDAATADGQIAELLSWLAERDAPARWLVGAQTEPPDLRERLARARCRPERTSVVMAASLSGREVAGRRMPAGVEIAAVRDEAGLREALSFASRLDDDPRQRERELALLASLGLGADRPLQHRAALRQGRAVGVASAFATGSTLLLTELGVAAAERRAGIGRALVLDALREGARAGCSVALLGPTPATVPFYEALGFSLVRDLPDRSFYVPPDA